LNIFFGCAIIASRAFVTMEKVSLLTNIAGGLAMYRDA
jgi:hypothetical protein